VRGLIGAIRTLTIIPLPGRNPERLASALPWFPVVGALLGLLLWAAVLLLGLLPAAPDNGPVIAAMLLAGSCFLTRGLHLDGLADFADGFGGGRHRDRTLEIMKDSHVGAFGVIALIVVLIAKWSAFMVLLDCRMVSWTIAAMAASRAVQVHLAVRLPYARAEGGTAEPFVREASAASLPVAWMLAAALPVIACGPLGFWLAPPGLLLATLLGLWFRARVGGATGDLLGAAGELTETALLVSAALGGRLLAAFTGWTWLWSALAR
jgi:adenosylcobinamide-GDP ribazoletransferase